MLKITVVSRIPGNVCEKPNNSCITQRTSRRPLGKLSPTCSKLTTETLEQGLKSVQIKQ